ncbi:pimeloyl-ACP methyl ester carboxylesterase [Clavibacter sp. B3I6]|uniref:alpha/beta fold hydrolase n=1 Tax=Clavibacter sp. B3I6 TaxID=3042268 RepID=UPI00278AE535|nr:alpha/beta hydrolase [Clavibacter sp. B3I6]MDQ0743002.1 pimeloyl-ACP methyl ester carboxylesterase [Clavibacter sp. B3I6]
MSATVVLVHGGFVDGSGWRGVYDELHADGLDVRIVQHATKSLADDAATTRDVLDGVDGPVVLVGHSYGGAVITEAGNHDKVAALVYVTAFAPDEGESVNTLLGGFPQDGPQPPILPPINGYLLLDRANFHDSFAADISAEDAAFLADSQVPWGLDALGDTITDAAWRSKPSWYLHVGDDRMIPPVVQTSMAARIGATVVETPGSHAIYVSQPKTVADIRHSVRDAVASSAK